MRTPEPLHDKQRPMLQERQIEDMRRRGFALRSSSMANIIESGPTCRIKATETGCKENQNSALSRRRLCWPVSLNRSLTLVNCLHVAPIVTQVQSLTMATPPWIWFETNVRDTMSQLLSLVFELPGRRLIDHLRSHVCHLPRGKPFHRLYWRSAQRMVELRWNVEVWCDSMRSCQNHDSR